MEQIVIHVEHISKDYKLYEKKSDRLKETLSLTRKQYHTPFHALKNITFDAQKGEVIGIIGTNGSGKSTLLKILTGVVAPTKGNYTINGKISALLELGAGFNSEYTGIQNIDLNGTMMGYTIQEMDSRREDIIKFADIGNYINQPVKNYSSGMFARLAFAVAISIEPDILIVDEALSVGDMFFQNKCFRKFDELKKKGTTILFVSHDIDTVREMCSRVLWIEHGEQQMFGPSNEVCKAYFNEQTRRLNEHNQQIVNTIDKEQTGIVHKNITLRAPQIKERSDSMYSEKARVLSAYITDSSGLFTNVLYAGKRYTIGIITEYHKDMDNIIVGFTISNRKGIVALASNTYINNEESIRVKAGDILESSFSFTIPQLRKGEYEISPAIAQGTQENHINLTWLHGVLEFTLCHDAYEISDLGIPYAITNRTIDSIIFY